MEKLEVIPESVGEFTGTTDKYGKKIFENDIIIAEDHPIKGKYIVKYNPFGFEAINTDKKAEHQKFFVVGYWNIEVIGHSYDILTEEE